MQVTFHGQSMSLVGLKMNVGDPAREVQLVAPDLAWVKPLEISQGKPRLFITVPSLDTSVCSLEARTFDHQIQALGDQIATFLVSADLPFAQNRWAQAEGIQHLTLVSDYRDRDFARQWGVLVPDLALLARAVFVVDGAGIVTYKQIVPELTDEPDYAAALDAVRSRVS